VSPSSSSPVIRSAAVGDAAALAELGVQLGYECSPQSMASRLQLLPESQSVVVAQAGAQVVGWIQFGVGLAIESSPFVEISGLVIDVGYRRQGIGRRLLECARDWTLARGIDTLRVRSNTVRAETHAFYLKRGFGLLKEQKVFAADNLEERRFS
jgi:GNAT superfamily N-acetyltransferase